MGPKEAESDTVSVRFRGRQDSHTMAIGQFLEAVKQKIARKDIDVTF